MTIAGCDLCKPRIVLRIRMSISGFGCVELERIWEYRQSRSENAFPLEVWGRKLFGRVSGFLPYKFQYRCRVYKLTAGMSCKSVNHVLSRPWHFDMDYRTWFTTDIHKSISEIYFDVILSPEVIVKYQRISDWQQVRVFKPSRIWGSGRLAMRKRRGSLCIVKASPISCKINFCVHPLDICRIHQQSQSGDDYKGIAIVEMVQ